MLTGKEIEELHNERDESYIMTLSGRKFYPFKPDAGDVDLNDIASSLSKSCRYSGHTPGFYSVAEHCVKASETLERLVVGGLTKESARCITWALLHDASEAYLNDLPRPIKNHMPHYRLIENDIQKAILDHFEINLTNLDEAYVHKVDAAMLFFEKDAFGWEDREWQITPNAFYHMTKLKKAVPEIECWDHKRAEQEFLNRFEKVTADEWHRL